MDTVYNKGFLVVVYIERSISAPSWLPVIFLFSILYMLALLVNMFRTWVMLYLSVFRFLVLLFFESLSPTKIYL